jgi:hypothetical protein
MVPCVTNLALAVLVLMLLLVVAVVAVVVLALMMFSVVAPHRSQMRWSSSGMGSTSH